MKNKIEDLRNHLFETLERLKDGDEKMPLDRARTIVDVAQAIINSAKVEVDYLRTVQGTKGTGFIPHEQLGTPSRPRLVKGSATRDDG